MEELDPVRSVAAFGKDGRADRHRPGDDGGREAGAIQADAPDERASACRAGDADRQGAVLGAFSRHEDEDAVALEFDKSRIR